MALTEQPGGYTLKGLVIPIYAPAFLSYLAQGLTTSFVVLYALQLGAGPGAAGVIAALQHLGTLFFDIPAGRFTERFNLKRVYMFSTLFLGIFLFLIWFLDSLPFLIMLLIGFGAARTSWSISQVTVVRRLVDPGLRGRALANMGGLVRAGSFLGPVMGGYIADILSLGALFLSAALCTFISTALILLRTPETEEENGAPPVFRRIPETFHRYSRILLSAGTGVVILGVLRSARPVLLPLYGESLGLSLGQIGLVMGLSGLADSLLFYPAGIIYDRCGIKRGGVLCLGLFSLGLILLPLSGGFISFALVSVFIGISNGFGSGINMAMSAILAPDGEVGEFMGIWRLFTDAGVFSGPLAVGLITAALSLAAAPFALGALGLAGALYFQYSVHESNEKP